MATSDYPWEPPLAGTRPSTWPVSSIGYHRPLRTRWLLPNSREHVPALPGPNTLADVPDVPAQRISPLLIAERGRPSSGSRAHRRRSGRVCGWQARRSRRAGMVVRCGWSVSGLRPLAVPIEAFPLRRANDGTKWLRSSC